MRQFKEPSTLAKVAEFMHLNGQPILRYPRIPHIERQELRVELLEEEVRELKDALKSNNLVEVADACADIQYVLSGAIHEFGLADCFDDLFTEVHNSNMSKSCVTEFEAVQTREKYAKEGVEVYFKERDGKFIVYRTEDNKVLKSINYYPARLAPILEEASSVKDEPITPDEAFKGVSPHQQRVIDEEKELKIKYKALKTFIEDTNSIFSTLPVEEQVDMRIQAKAMELYGNALLSRIIRF